MLVLKRNETEMGIIYDNSTLAPSIRPWDWYWYDEDTQFNFSLDTVKAWKDYGNRNALMTNKQELKEYEANYMSDKSDMRSTSSDVKQAFLDQLFTQE